MEEKGVSSACSEKTCVLCGIGLKFLKILLLCNIFVVKLENGSVMNEAAGSMMIGAILVSSERFGLILSLNTPYAAPLACLIR